MNYIVFDLEWNIAGRANKVAPEIQTALPFEIIEIGAVKLDADFRYIDKFSVYIRPQLYPILSGYVAAVTRRLQQSMKYGLAFPDAAREFLTWCGQDYLFCTWSESDTATLKMNLKYYGLADELQVRCLDVQYVFDARIEKADTQRSIEYAVDFLRLSKSQPFHQAVNDAWYTGQILKKMAEILKEEEPEQNFVDRYAFDPNLNRSYQLTLGGLATVEAALLDLQNQSLDCPACGLTLENRLQWTRDGNKALATFCCPVHGRINGKSRFRTKGDVLLQTSVTIRLDRDQDN
jgi:inhibitor of KinA sporulation pathway (predicted exonuclease)